MEDVLHRKTNIKEEECLFAEGTFDITLKRQLETDKAENL